MSFEVLAAAIATILPMRQLRLRGVKGLVQSHTAAEHGELALERRQSDAMLTLKEN